MAVAPRAWTSICASIRANRSTPQEKEAVGLELSPGRRKEGARHKRKENKAV